LLDRDRNGKDAMHRFIEQGDREMRKLAQQAETDLANFWRAAKQKINADRDESPELRALEVMPEEVKLLYTKAVVAQALVDAEVDPREVASVYVFASRIGLNTDSRREIRRCLAAGAADRGSGFSETLKLVSEVLSEVREEEKETVAASLIKDLLWISRADGAVSPPEHASVDAVAREQFGDKAEDVISQAEESIDTEEAYVRGDISVSEFEKRLKQVASQAAAMGLPVAAIYFSGSVVGLSAAGFTSGLAALGLGGVLGLSSMLTGIGVVIVAGVATYQLARWALGANERELVKKREHMIQEVLKQHQKSMADLAQDIGEIAVRMEEYTAKSDRNAERLAWLKSELQMFKAALATLQDREKDLEYREEQLAT
jgi:uncharacterized tellurite resistance protein B-like protein/membrane protein implicated in regulation of membrane protease activity